VGLQRGGQEGATSSLRIDYAAYTLFTSSVRRDHPQRLYLATVAGYMANYGPNVTLISEAMQKSEPFVRKLIREVEAHLYDDDFVG
jgi:hypothetical protein